MGMGLCNAVILCNVAVLSAVTVLRNTVYLTSCEILRSEPLQHIIVAHRNKQALAKSCIRNLICQGLSSQTAMDTSVSETRNRAWRDYGHQQYAKL